VCTEEERKRQLRRRLNEQNELSTIIEKELTSQRRSSNGGTQLIQDRHNLKVEKDLEALMRDTAGEEVQFETEGKLREMKRVWEIIQQKERKIELMAEAMEKQKAVERREMEENKFRMDMMM